MANDGEITVLTDKIKLDKKLILSNSNFMKVLEKADERPLKWDHVKDCDPLPTPYIMALFAKLAYEDNPTPPEDWELLTTARNKDTTNGYFGVVFWNPKLQQVVIAHRGTIPTKMGALWSDYKGVFKNKFVPQINSAVTLAHYVKEALGKSMQLCFTGHSLGGWLAQITTLSAKYLQPYKNGEDKFFCFVKGSKVCHPHTVVFESPGCSEMLTKIKQQCDLRYRSYIDLERLDISTYLSAPNYINGCNIHMGVVYRVITDMSDVSSLSLWLMKGQYTLIAHKMDKMLEALKGQGEWDVVLDWPLLLVKDEKSSFFVGARPVNSFHIETKAELPHDGKDIRYNTVPYKKNERSLRVFSEEELKLLENLKALQKQNLKINFFSAINSRFCDLFINNRDCKFDIDVYDVKCENLRDLLMVFKQLKRCEPAYIQRLLLDEKDCTSIIFENESRQYLKSLKEYEYEYKDVLNLTEFLRSTSAKILQIVSEDCGFEMSRVYKLMKSEEKKLFLSGEQVTSLANLFEISDILSNQSSLPVLVIEFSAVDNFDWIKLLRVLRNTNTKLILVTDEEKIKNEGDVITVISSGFCFKDFTETTQEDIIKRLSADIPILSKMDVCYDRVFEKIDNIKDILASSDQISTVISGKGAEKFQNNPHVIKIAPSLTIEQFKDFCKTRKDETIAWFEIKNNKATCKLIYSPRYYMARAFKDTHLIDLDKLLNKECEDELFVLYPNQKSLKLPDNSFMANDEIEAHNKFEGLEEVTAHLLQIIDKKKLKWIKSRGNLQNLSSLAKLINEHEIQEEELSDYFAKHNTLLIADNPGTGKSTSVVSIVGKLTRTWVIHVILRNHLGNIREVGLEKITLKEVVDFLLKTLEEHDLFESTIKEQILMDKLKNDSDYPVTIFFDGFDEIRGGFEEHAQKSLLAILKYLKSHTKARICVATRKHELQSLQSDLSTLGVALKPIGEDRQKEFLKNFWDIRLRLTMKQYGMEEKKKMHVYTEVLYMKAVEMFGDNMKEFMGIPLQMRMLAETAIPNHHIFKMSEEEIRAQQFDVEDVFRLYQKFIELKYDIYFKEKAKVYNPDSHKIHRCLKCMNSLHQTVAFKKIFPDLAESFLGRSKIMLKKNDRVELDKVGLIQNNEFSHPTFAEFFCAELFKKWLLKDNEQRIELMISEILLRLPRKIIRLFLNSQIKDLVNFNADFFRENVMKLWTEKRYKLLNYKHEDAFHILIREKHWALVSFLLKALKNDAVNLLRKRNNERKTPLYVVAEQRNRSLLEEIIQSVSSNEYEQLLWATVFRSPRDENDKNIQWLLHNETTLSYEFFKNKWAQIEAPPTLQDPKLQPYLLTTTNDKGYTALHLASKAGNYELVEQLVANFIQYGVDLDPIEQETCLTPLHLAAINGHFDIVKLLVNRGANQHATDMYNVTVIAYAAKFGHLNIVEYLIEQNADFTVPDRNKISPLAHAAKEGHLKVVKYLKKKGCDIDSVDKFGMCPLKWAVKTSKTGHLDVTKYLINNHVDLDSVDRHGRTALHIAARIQNSKGVKLLIDSGASTAIRDLNGLTALDVAKKGTNKKIIAYLQQQNA